MAVPALIHPERLFWLLLVPVVWWLAQPPRPRLAVLTAHLRQWLAARDALRRRPVRRRRLRTWLLLAAVALAVLGHSELRLRGSEGPDRLTVLLDGSASMQAREQDGSSAWQRALGLLEREFARLPDQVEVRLLVAGAKLERRQGMAARSLQDLAPPGGACGIGLQAVASELANDPRSAVWTLTDGQGAALPDQGALTVLGSPRGNHAIASVQVTDRWPLPQLSLEVLVQDWSGRRTDAVLVVSGPVEPVPETALSLAAGARERVVLALLRQPAGGRLELQLRSSDDALAADDTWACQLPPLPAPRIAVWCDAEAGPAIHVAADAMAAEVGGSVVAAGSGEPAAFVLAEGGQADLRPGAVRSLSFGTRLPGVEQPVPWNDVAVLDWDRTDALTAGLDLSELRIAQAWRGILPKGKVLITGQVTGGPPEPLLVYVAGPEGIASLHAAFRLQDSSLWMLAAFPQLLRRSLLRAYGEAAAIVPDPQNLTATSESDLQQRGGGTDRPLPAFATEGRNLTVWCLVLALLLLALRSWLR